MEGISAPIATNGSTTAVIRNTERHETYNAYTPRDGLSDYSPKDRKWDAYRGQTELLADFLAEYGEFQRYAERMEKCSGLLHFGWETQPETGESRLRLRNAQFCRFRHCATCAWRRSLAMTARLLEALPGLTRDHPTGRWIFLTLTVPNCPVGELAATLKTMNEAWNRLRLRREFKPVQGWARSTEVTREAKREGYAHPHFHCLLLVPRSMMAGKHYVKHARWVELWRDCMRLDVDPVVDVRAVKGSITAAVAEVVKVFGYSVKPEVAAADPEWFLELIRQVHRKRFFASGGVLKETFKEPETDKEMIQGDQPAEGIDDGSRLAFAWAPTQQRYKRAPKADGMKRGGQ